MCRRRKFKSANSIPALRPRCWRIPSAAPIEQEINGVINSLYVFQRHFPKGYLTIGGGFDIGTDPDQAAIGVSNKVQAAASKLPAEVTKQGVKRSNKSRMRFCRW